MAYVAHGREGLPSGRTSGGFDKGRTVELIMIPPARLGTIPALIPALMLAFVLNFWDDDWMDKEAKSMAEARSGAATRCPVCQTALLLDESTMR